VLQVILRERIGLNLNLPRESWFENFQIGRILFIQISICNDLLEGAKCAPTASTVHVENDAAVDTPIHNYTWDIRNR
jgi:hypothetical protein